MLYPHFVQISQALVKANCGLAKTEFPLHLDDLKLICSWDSFLLLFETGIIWFFPGTMLGN
jgi:hypothetical protein